MTVDLSCPHPAPPPSASGVRAACPLSSCRREECPTKPPHTHTQMCTPSSPTACSVDCVPLEQWQEALQRASGSYRGFKVLLTNYPEDACL